MPEIKNSFTQGRMNKDLDERILPKGEYRDALNIEVSTSEGSNVGSVQSIRGNVEVTNMVSDDATCLGYVVDEAADCVYYFVQGALNQTFIHKSINGIKTDAILRYTAPTSPNGYGTTDVIFSDVHEVLATPPRSISTFTTSHPLIIPAVATPFSQVAVEDGTGICVGMEMMAYDGNGIPLWPGGPTTVLSIEEPTAGVLTQRLILMSSYRPHITSAQQAAGAFYKFNHEKALNFNVGGPLAYSTDNGTTGIFETKEILNRIHSANVIDNLLFFTDNNDEPKKINIDRCKAGTQGANPFQSRTLLKVEDETGNNFIDPSLNDTNLQINTIGISAGAGGTFGQYTAVETPIRKEHITVIRKNPDKPLAVTLEDEKRPGTTNVTLNTAINPDGVVGGSVIELQHNATLDYIIGDVVELSNNAVLGGVPAGDVRIVGTIINVDTTSTPGTTFIEISVNSATNNQPNASGAFNIVLQDDQDLYELTFPKFSYRYKYEDGEYSSYAPFSRPAFLPGSFSLDAEEGHNTGMQNRIKRILLKDFVPADIPEDVKEVEILYKDSVSPNIYTIDSFNRFSDEFRKTPLEYFATGSSSLVTEYTDLTNKNHRGRLEITEEAVGAALPSNQLIRPFDNVPRKAITQEISANRIIYGNYLQNYDLTDGVNAIQIDMDVSISQYKRENGSTVGHPSVKSDRKYQVGVVYRDKYGRETPVLTNEKCTINADQSLNRTINQISVVLRNDPPFWADSYKFYVKEAATEYYNIAVDRVYPCENEPNMFWASFNSADRNKIDEETLLRLVKVDGLIGGDAYDTLRNDYDSEPYKIISIKSEVPESLKKTYEYYTTIGHQKLANGVAPFQAGNYVTYANYANMQANSGSEPPNPRQNVKAWISSGRRDDGTWDPQGSGLPNHDAMDFRPGGVWEMLSCGTMYTDYLANQPELQMRVTQVAGVHPQTGVQYFHSAAAATAAGSLITNPQNFHGGNLVQNAPAGFPVNQTNWMTINGITDNRFHLAQDVGRGTDFPHYRISCKNYKFPSNDTYANWGTNTGAPVNRVFGFRYEFRKVVRKTKEEHQGKFFVKMRRKMGTTALNVLGGPLAGELNVFGEIIEFGQRNGPNATRNSAVFEVLPKREQDIELYYEASKAYPILTKNASHTNLIRSKGEGLINVGDIVTAYEITSTGVMQELTTSASYVSALTIQTHPFDSAGTQTVVGYIDDYNDDGVISVQLISSGGGGAANQNITSSTTSDIYFKFTNPQDFSSVTLKLAMPTFNASTSITNPQGNGFIAGTFTSIQGLSNIINLLPFGHPGQSNHLGQLDEIRVGLSYFNCFSQRGLAGLEVGVESNRIRDDFNAPTIDKGVRASTVFDNYQEERRASGLIYSGIYNSTSGINDINQFIQGEKITKDLNPIYGSIQKIHTMENNLLALCEDKCLKVLTNKDALFNADGNPQLTATNRVLGDATPFAGDYGISQNPESFAYYGFKSFFTDAKRGVVVRLSQNGLTPISEIGMKSYFSENLGTRTMSAVGSYDSKKQDYNLTITNSIDKINRGSNTVEGITVSYSISSQGWTSFKSWIKENGFSLSNKYYTTFGGEIYRHHVDDTFTATGFTGTLAASGVSSTTLTLSSSVEFLAPGFLIEGDGIPNGTTVVSIDSFNEITLSTASTVFSGTTLTFNYPTNNFYSGALTNSQNKSTLTFIFNDAPDTIKSFKTLNYEGTQAKILENVDDIEYYNNVAQEGWHVETITTDQQEGRVQEFKNKEGKWYNQIQGDKTEWTSADGVASARGNVDPREFAVQGIGLSKAISVENEDGETIGPDSGVKSFVEVIQEFTAPVGWCTSIQGTSATRGWCTVKGVGERMQLVHGLSIGTTAQPLRNFEQPAATTNLVSPLAGAGTVGGYPTTSGTLPIVPISPAGSPNNNTTNPGNYSTMLLYPEYHIDYSGPAFSPLATTGQITFNQATGNWQGNLSLTAKDLFIPNYPGPVGQWDNSHPAVHPGFSGSGLEKRDPHPAYASIWPNNTPQNISGTIFDLRTNLAPATPPWNNTAPWTINSTNNSPAASSGLSWPSSMNPVIHTVIQAASASNDWMGIHQWEGGWLPSEISYIRFSDQTPRLNERDSHNYVLVEVYWNDTGNSLLDNGLVNAFIPGPGGSEVYWGFHFDADGPNGGCWKASHSVQWSTSASMLSAPQSGLLVNNNTVSNSSVTITPNYFFTTNTSSNSTNGNSQLTYISGNQPKTLDTLFTATFLADSGYHIKQFPTVRIISENPENYTIERVEEIDVVDGKAGSGYIARINADQALVSSGSKKYSVVKQTEEERRRKLLATEPIINFEDDILEIESPYTSDAYQEAKDGDRLLGNFVRKRIIKIKHNGKTSVAGDTITFNHNVTANPTS